MKNVSDQLGSFVRTEVRFKKMDKILEHFSDNILNQVHSEVQTYIQNEIGDRLWTQIDDRIGIIMKS
jgi:hypothetical protein